MAFFLDFAIVVQEVRRHWAPQMLSIEYVI